MDPELLQLGEAIARGDRRVAAGQPGPLVAWAVDRVEKFTVVGILDTRYAIAQRVTQVWVCDHHAWRCTGGSSSYPESAEPTSRTMESRVSVAWDGANGASLVSSGFWPWSGRYLNYAWLQASSVTKHVEILGTKPRLLEVPWRTSLVIAWTERPHILTINRSGLHLGSRSRLPQVRALS